MARSSGVIGHGTATGQQGQKIEKEKFRNFFFFFLRFPGYFREHFPSGSLCCFNLSVRETCALMFINFIPSDLRIIQVLVIYTSL